MVRLKAADTLFDLPQAANDAAGCAYSLAKWCFLTAVSTKIGNCLGVAECFPAGIAGIAFEQEAIRVDIDPNTPSCSSAICAVVAGWNCVHADT